MAELVQFGKHVISRQNVFLRSKLSFAFVNRKPVLPGHVLVATHRVVARFGELTSDEVADLFQCAHRIAPVLQSAFNATALTLALQDGVAAGQTVEHVHVHIIPRKLGDFERNDDIYDHLAKHDSAGVEEAEKFRSGAEMAKEAQFLESLFK